jgi:hypothetical protein
MAGFVSGPEDQPVRPLRAKILEIRDSANGRIRQRSIVDTAEARFVAKNT